MEHAFAPSDHGPYSLGIEEELMIVDGQGDLVNAIETLLKGEGFGPGEDGVVQPELMESVLEIATPPLANTAEAGRALRALRARVIASAAAHDLQIASAGTHPFARWEDQRIVARSRYRDLINALRFVARQELIFGLHVHVGVDDPDKAVHVANGMRVHAPILQALSANSPYWRGDRTGLESTRTPIFRQFPRVGIPPRYEDWADYERQIDFMIRSGVMEDYTFLWYDVRPHARFGTVEVRACDAQTRVEHTLGLAALIQAMVKELCEHFDRGEQLTDYPFQMLDENKWLAARHGLDGQLVDLPSSDRVAARDLAARLLDRLRPHAQDLGSADELEGIQDLIDRGTGAHRQVVVYDANEDMRELMHDIVEATAP